jgi:hypothetical protein
MCAMDEELQVFATNFAYIMALPDRYASYIGYIHTTSIDIHRDLRRAAERWETHPPTLPTPIDATYASVNDIKL